MDEKDKIVLKNLAKALPELTDIEKERVLGFSEGLVYVTIRKKEEQQTSKGA